MENTTKHNITDIVEEYKKYEFNRPVEKIVETVVSRGDVRKLLFKKILQQKHITKTSFNKYMISKKQAEHFAFILIEKGVLLQNELYYFLNPTWFKNDPICFKKIQQEEQQNDNL